MTTVEIAVTEQSQIGEARREASRLAWELGFADADAARAALVATELASNLVKHGGGGSILISRAADWPEPAIDLLGLDRGPGIKNLPRALQDGYSTAGSPGTGLGAVHRQAELVEIHTTESSGTAILARIARGRAEGARSRLAVLSVPRPGEEQNGDSVYVRNDPGSSVVVVADGLGHGAAAFDAAEAARRIAAGAKPEASPSDIVQRIHDGLRATRGAAVAVASINPDAGEMRFAGIGNISAALFANGTQRSAVSMHGTAGHTVREVREFRYQPITRGTLLIMHSDGISTRWDLRRYGGVEQRDPALIGGLIWRESRRMTDDATIVVMRI